MKSEALVFPPAAQVHLLVSVNPSFTAGESAHVLGEILPTFARFGVTRVQLYFMKALETDARLASVIPPDDFARLRFTDNFDDIRIDWALVYGGDGALLWAHKALVRQPQVVYFSVKTGNLGVLTAFVTSDLPQLIEDMSAAILGRPEQSQLVVKRFYRLLGTVIDGNNQVVRQFAAVNELVLFRNTNYCPKFAIHVNGCPMLRMSADGLILCTPLGSTAYNSSVGGPTLLPYLPNYVLSSIAPFGVNFRPFVFGASDVLSIAVDPSCYHREIKAVGDSNVEAVIRDGERLEVRLEGTPEFRLASFARNFQEDWTQKVQQVFKWDP